MLNILIFRGVRNSRPEWTKAAKKRQECAKLKVENIGGIILCFGYLEQFFIIFIEEAKFLIYCIFQNSYISEK